MTASVLIPLSRGLFAIVDEADYEAANSFRWSASPSYRGHYATRNSRAGPNTPRITLLHRFLLQASVGVFVDHINGDGLDNRRSNLRLCTCRQNAYNTGSRVGSSSRFKGVYLKGRRWKAQIRSETGVICLGTFDAEEDAARAYDDKARVLHGEFARLNLPEAA